jgi:hypothetical protein
MIKNKVAHNVIAKITHYGYKAFPMINKQFVVFGATLLCGMVAAFAQGDSSSCRDCRAIEVDAQNLEPEVMKTLFELNGDLMKNNWLSYYRVLHRSMDGTDGLAYCMEFHPEHAWRIDKEALPALRRLKASISDQARPYGNFKVVVKSDCY